MFVPVHKESFGAKLFQLLGHTSSENTLTSILNTPQKSRKDVHKLDCSALLMQFYA